MVPVASGTISSASSTRSWKRSRRPSSAGVSACAAKARSSGVCMGYSVVLASIPGRHTGRAPVQPATSFTAGAVPANHRGRQGGRMSEARTVQIGDLAVSNRAPLTLIAGPVPARGPRPRAAHRRGAGGRLRRGRRGPHLQGVLRQGQPHLAVGASAASGWTRGCAILAEVRDRVGCPVLTDVHAARPLRPGGRGGRRAPDPGLPLPPDRPPARGRRDRRGDQRQEGPVPRALGHGATSPPRSPRPATSASCSASAASPSATTRWSPTCARCRSWRAPAIRW